MKRITALARGLELFPLEKKKWEAPFWGLVRNGVNALMNGNPAVVSRMAKRTVHLGPNFRARFKGDFAQPTTQEIQIILG